MFLWLIPINHDFTATIGIFAVNIIAGDGNLHIYIIGDDKISVADFKGKADEFFDDIYAEATRVGGLVSGEHAIGSGKLDYLAKSVGPTQMKLMEDIKRVFDPKMILNPGKVCYKL